MMKKKALIAGVLMSVFSMGMSAYAEKTLNIKDTTRNDLTYDYNTKLSGSTSGAVVRINVTRDQKITFNNSLSSTGTALSSEEFKITQNNTVGILHDSTATTTIDGNGLWISSTSHLDNVKSIVNQSGILKFTNTRLLVSGKVENAAGATMIVDNEFDLGSSSSDVSNKSIGIDNQGSMQINGKFSADVYNDNVSGDNSFYDDYSEMYAINNQGTLNIAKAESIFGDIKHNSGAQTKINFVSDTLRDSNSPFGVNWCTFNGNVLNSDSNFEMTINKNASWMPRNQSGEVEGIKLNGGWISLSIDNYIWNDSVSHGDYWSYEWNDNYDTLTLKDIQISNTKFSGSKVIKSFVLGSGGFSLSTDLANNKGDKIVFTGTPNISPNIDKIGLVIWDKNNNPQNIIKEDDGKSVTLIEAPESSNMKFESALGFGRNYQSFRIYEPIIKEETDGSTHKWNFVGWKVGDAGDILDQQLPSKEPYINTNELDNVFKRVMDIRNDPSEVGVWIRGETGKMKIEGYGYDYNLTSGGHDWKHENNAGILFGGFGITHSVNKCDTGIIGDTKSTGYNLYGSWLGKDNNDYVDVILKYGKMDKTYAGLDINNIFAAGSYSKDVLSIAAKYGRRYEMRNDWYYEPFAGLTWGKISDVDFKDARGFNIHGDSVTSKIANLGMQVGKKMDKRDFYYRMNLVHDFDGKMHVNVPGTTTNAYTDMGGTWLKCAIGTSAKIGKNNSYYIDLEKDFGSKVEKPWSISAGYRHTW